jgi:hypothetical protein
MTSLRQLAVNALLMTLAGSFAFAQQGTILRTTTFGVRIDALVSNNGRPITGLHADDFEVLDKGIPQRLDAAEAAGHVAVAFMIDASLSERAPSMMTWLTLDSRAPNFFPSIVRACEILLGSLVKSDRAALVVAADRVLPLVPLTEQASAWRQGLAQVQGLPPRAVPLFTNGRGTVRFAHETDGLMPQSSVWDGTFVAASLVARDPGRALVVVLSDGIDDASWLTRGLISRTLADLGIPVDLVQTPWRRFHAGVATPEGLAKATGGNVYKTDDSKLGEKFKARLDYLRQSYVLTYEPKGVSTNDGWHEVVVKVKGRNATVKARPGYYANRPAK